jgi:hypothetical protein
MAHTRLRLGQLLPLLGLLLACATPAPPAVAPVGTLARARQDYRASLDFCQEVRGSRLSTLGPPIFQPISGDAPFNECLSRAKTDFDVELNEAN